VKLSDILGFHGLSICRQVPRLPWRRRPCLALLILSGTELPGSAVVAREAAGGSSCGVS